MKLIKNDVVENAQENEEEVIEVVEKKSIRKTIMESKPVRFVAKHKKGIAITMAMAAMTALGIRHAVKHADDDITIVDLDEDDGIDPSLMEDDSETEETAESTEA